MKQKRLGIVMDPIQSINPKKDTSLALLLEAQTRGWQIEYMELNDLSLRDGRTEARMRKLRVADDPNFWFDIEKLTFGNLAELDLILMRKDPPFDIEYIMATYILERAEAEGVMVVNSPQGLRDANEKVFTAWFPQCCPPSLLSRSTGALREFLEHHHKIVVKPTSKMGGQSIFVISEGDPNTNVILEEMTHRESVYVQAQAYIPEIAEKGDKRIFLIDGIPLEYGIARIPGGDDHRGNLAVGARAEGFELGEREQWICAQIGPELKERGLLFVGIDVIGDYLTEINVTSPTGAREIEKIFQVSAAARLFDVLEERLAAAKPKDT
ncbi:glutathione synthase [Algoriphagus sp. H41]|uniref:Glutathione synthetase n=1 Tax=Algoriphagus oliviformis TaxID=2811231 RepID=A0ABS3C973_9BACT|nr:glutathione synthase [Algoriphagus oliviformis]MBN7813667.1 glutathione synthase [Algoriphagus oliviformis]